MLRSLFFYTVFFPLTIFHCWRMAWKSRRSDSEYWGERIGGKWSGQVIRLAGAKVELDLSAIKPEGHYVFMVNHQSNFDIIVTYHHLWKNRIRYVAKQSLFEVPIFKHAMRGAGHIPVDRSNRRAGMKSVEKAVEKAKAGVSPLIFPEGTRSQELSKLQPFKIGGIVLALKCGLPVVPVVIHGTGLFQPKGKFKLHPEHTIRMKALEPIDPSAYTLKEREKFKNDLYEKMNAAYLQLGQETQ